jgi:hypothetical protein
MRPPGIDGEILDGFLRDWIEASGIDFGLPEGQVLEGLYPLQERGFVRFEIGDYEHDDPYSFRVVPTPPGDPT